jgi:hypothetical protein
MIDPKTVEKIKEHFHFKAAIIQNKVNGYVNIKFNNIHKK